MPNEIDLTKTASSEAQELLAKIFKNLGSAGVNARSAIGEDKFFPHGIELIYVKVEAGLSDKIKVSAELRIAGEKGVSPTGSRLEENAVEGAAETGTGNKELTTRTRARQ